MEVYGKKSKYANMSTLKIKKSMWILVVPNLRAGVWRCQKVKLVVVNLIVPEPLRV